MRSCERRCASLFMYAVKQARSRQRLTMTISCASRSERQTSRPRKPSAESTRPMRLRNARTRSSACSASTFRRDIDTYTRASEIDRHVLRLEELLDAPVAAFATEARLLHASERRADVGDHALVQADHPGLEPLAHAKRALDVAREHVRDEAE